MQAGYDSRLTPYIRDAYTVNDLDALRTYLESQGTFEFVPLTSGLYPATPTNSEAGRYRYVWVRDNVHIAHALWQSGSEEEAVTVIQALVRYFDRHADRFDACIDGRVDSTDPMQRPHVRFDGDTLDEVSEPWSHAQNDAHGLFLWLTGCMLHAGVWEPDATAVKVVSRMLRFLVALPFHTDRDSGAWEEERAVRASSIGAVCAGMRVWHALLHDWNHDLSHHVQSVYLEGRAALDRILPYEVHSEEVREYDAALLFLVEPLRMIEGDQAQSIVDRLVSRLQGQRGMKRYERDAFWGPGYDQLSASLRTSDASNDASFRAQYAVAGKEAEWTLFDPLLARYYSRKADLLGDSAAAVRSAQHINRTLAALVRTSSGTLLLPELYYHTQGERIPNPIVPLYWAQANLLLSLT